MDKWNTLAIAVNRGEVATQPTRLATANLVVFPVCLLREEPGLLQLVLQRLHPLLVGERTVLEHLAHTETERHLVLKRHNYYPTVKRRVINHECWGKSLFWSLFITEDYSLAHSYTFQET